ncbi:hypothetical protein AY601_3033 [Pedobacter cryoconitis]|uniref:Uncharacterized protein n=1 Tax=Pedobacter cryoconitis TaxID=188932 RepID=A0A127VEZ4_9SPHI|nr:hypothetical protein AY601_3033 [Pedobacter cryoconitis]
MARNWYTYNGTGEELLCSSYTLASIRPSCFNGHNICAIYAVGGVYPTCPLSANIRNYIATVLITFLASPDNSNLAVKKYAYGRNI